MGCLIFILLFFSEPAFRQLDRTGFLPRSNELPKVIIPLLAKPWSWKCLSSKGWSWNMRKKRKTRKVLYLLCLAGLDTVCINPGNALILIWRNVSNLIYSPQLNSDWGCSSLDLKALSDCVCLIPPLLASNIWVSPWEERSILLDALSGCVCALGCGSWECSASCWDLSDTWE